MNPQDHLEAQREPHNAYDANAIKLMHQGVQIGHIKRELAAELAPLMDSGQAKVLVKISDLTGGEIQHNFFGNEPNQKNRGCNIQIQVEYSPEYMAQFV